MIFSSTLLPVLLFYLHSLFSVFRQSFSTLSALKRQVSLLESPTIKQFHSRDNGIEQRTQSCVNKIYKRMTIAKYPALSNFTPVILCLFLFSSLFSLLHATSLPQRTSLKGRNQALSSRNERESDLASEKLLANIENLSEQEGVMADHG